LAHDEQLVEGLKISLMLIMSCLLTSLVRIKWKTIVRIEVELLFVKNHSVGVATPVLFNVIDLVSMYGVRLTRLGEKMMQVRKSLSQS
jgi:hypothetical protein